MQLIGISLMENDSEKKEIGWIKNSSLKERLYNKLCLSL